MQQIENNLKVIQENTSWLSQQRIEMKQEMEGLLAQTKTLRASLSQ
jgi:hypothetical protein